MQVPAHSFSSFGSEVRLALLILAAICGTLQKDTKRELDGRWSKENRQTTRQTLSYCS